MLSSGGDCRGRRALCRARFCQRRRNRRRPHADRRSGSSRSRVGLRQRAELRRRSAAAFVSAIPPALILPSVALTTDWAGDFGLPADAVRGGMMISGMYDLEPVRLSARSEYVRFTDATVDALSPQRHVDRLTCPIMIAHGTLETPGPRSSARAFAAASRKERQARRVTRRRGLQPFRNSGDACQSLRAPSGRAALKMMKLIQ